MGLFVGEALNVSHLKSVVVMGYGEAQVMKPQKIRGKRAIPLYVGLQPKVPEVLT